MSVNSNLLTSKYPTFLSTFENIIKPESNSDSGIDDSTFWRGLKITSITPLYLIAYAGDVLTVICLKIVSCVLKGPNAFRCASTSHLDESINNHIEKLIKHLKFSSPRGWLEKEKSSLPITHNNRTILRQWISPEHTKIIFNTVLIGTVAMAAFKLAPILTDGVAASTLSFYSIPTTWGEFNSGFLYTNLAFIELNTFAFIFLKFSSPRGWLEKEKSSLPITHNNWSILRPISPKHSIIFNAVLIGTVAMAAIKLAPILTDGILTTLGESQSLFCETLVKVQIYALGLIFLSTPNSAIKCALLIRPAAMAAIMLAPNLTDRILTTLGDFQNSYFFVFLTNVIMCASGFIFSSFQPRNGSTKIFKIAQSPNQQTRSQTRRIKPTFHTPLRKVE